MSAARPVALITGASGGIGLELARLCAKEGHDLVLVARNRAKLEEVAKYLSGMYGARAEIIPVDLATPDATDAIMAEVDRLELTVDVLINNAGAGNWGLFGRQPTDQILSVLQLNITSLTHLTRLVLPGMVHRRRGRILNVSSSAGFLPGPLMAVYYASKAYVTHLSEAIANELAGTGVTVTALCPGPVPTGFQEAAGMGGTNLVAGPGKLEAAAVARSGYRAMMRGKTVVVPGLVMKLSIQALRVAPRWLAVRIARWQLEQHG